MASRLKKTLYASEQSEELREAFLNDVHGILDDLSKAKFIDESSFNLSMTRLYGRAHKSERVIDKVPRNQGMNQTLICTLQLSGPVAPFIFEGAVNGDAFVWYVENVLCPSIEEGDIVFLDNLSAHYRDEVYDLIEERGGIVKHLPPYSPDLNPIEMLFSKLKAFVRGQRCRTLESLWEAVWEGLNRVSLDDVRGWFGASPTVAFL